jgi:hypothetical protein
MAIAVLREQQYRLVALANQNVVQRLPSYFLLFTFNFLLSPIQP